MFGNTLYGITHKLPLPNADAGGEDNDMDEKSES